MKNTINNNLVKTNKLGGSNSTISIFKNTRHSSILSIPESNRSNRMKKISIHQKKISVNKYMSDKYSSPLDLNSLLPCLPLNLRRKNNSNNISQTSLEGEFHAENESPFYLKGFKIKDIITHNTINRLKDTLYKDKKLKDQYSFVNENNFRSNYSEKDHICVIQEKIDNLSIPADNINLIRYLGNKKEISEKLVEKLDSSNDQKLNKYNKICQIIHHNIEKQDLFKSIINGKIDTMKKRPESEMNRLLNNVERNLINFKSIAEEYKKIPVNKNFKYYDKINEMKMKFWNKYHVDRLANKKSVSEKPKITTGNNISFKL